MPYSMRFPTPSTVERPAHLLYSTSRHPSCPRSKRKRSENGVLKPALQSSTQTSSKMNFGTRDLGSFQAVLVAEHMVMHNAE